MSFRLGSATFVGRRGVERRATVRISVVDVTGAAKRKDVPGWLAFLVAMGGKLSRDFFQRSSVCGFLAVRKGPQINKRPNHSISRGFLARLDQTMVKRFGGFRALDVLSFAVSTGEILGLVGPNGSGKTTCINVISGLYRPDGGTIRFAGRSIGGLPSHRVVHAGINRTFQIPRPFFNLTVRQNVETLRRMDAAATVRPTSRRCCPRSNSHPSRPSPQAS
jgi:ABC-type multidrug transport system fused ATPase/permease subunit